MQPIVPIRRKEPFDGDGGLFELKLDGFRGIANTVQGRMLSKNGNRLRRFEPLLNALPAGYVFDGEIVALDGGGRPMVPQSSANELAKNLSLGVAQPRLRRRAIEQNSSNQEGPDADQFGTWNLVSSE